MREEGCKAGRAAASERSRQLSPCHATCNENAPLMPLGTQRKREMGSSADGAGVAWTDFDKDGDLDVFIANDNGYQDMFFRNNGNGTFTEVTDLSISDIETPLGDPANGRGAAWADIDNDGDQDLYVANTYGYENNLFRNDATGGNQNHWLKVRLVGTTTNRAGIGSRVRIVTGTQSQIREIDGGSGYYSQNSRIVTFGLGTSALVDSVIVQWTNGQVQKQGQTAVDQLVTIQQCTIGNANVIENSMTAWATQDLDPSFMTLHFNFSTVVEATQFEIRYRRGNQTPPEPWIYVACTAPGLSCLFNPNSNYEAICSYTPCDHRKFEWQARAFNCNGWTEFGVTKTFEAFCLQEP